MFDDLEMTEKERILDEACKIITGNRNDGYGKPENSFKKIGEYWSMYLGVDVDCVDVSIMMVLLKIARMNHDKYYKDNWIDIAGYAACGAEVQKDYIENK